MTASRGSAFPLGRRPKRRSLAATTALWSAHRAAAGVDAARPAPCSPAHRPPLFPSSSSVVTRQIKYAWDYLYGALGAVSGEAHFAHLPGVSLEWDQSYLENLAASAPGAIHVRVREQAGFHLREGDPRLPPQVRILDLHPPVRNSIPASSSGTSSKMRPATRSLRQWASCGSA